MSRTEAGEGGLEHGGFLLPRPTPQLDSSRSDSYTPQRHPTQRVCPSSNFLSTFLLRWRAFSFMAPVTIHIEVLHTLLQSPSCPAPVLRLSGPLLLRVLPTTKIQPAPQSVARGVLPFDPQPLRKLASQSLGLTTEGNVAPST